MRKLVILRSLTGRARAFADREFKRFVWFPSADDARKQLAEMDRSKRPWLAVVDGGAGTASMGLGAWASGIGYVVETRGVP